MEATIGSVFLAAMITAIVTGLGAVPFLFVRQIRPWWLSIANGAAAGLMLGASHNLISEGTKLDPARVLLGILAGLFAIVVANRLIRRRQTVEIADPRGVNGRNSDNTRIRERLGWEPGIPLRDGLERTYAWIHDQYGARHGASRDRFAHVGEVRDSLIEDRPDDRESSPGVQAGAQ